MSEHYLLVTNPPHGSIEPAEGARALGCTPTELRMRANFPAPEIWVADQDEAAARDAGKLLIGSGLRIALIRGSIVAAVPSPDYATAISIAHGGITAKTAGEEIEISTGDRVVAVFGDTPSAEGEPRRESTARLSMSRSGMKESGSDPLGAATPDERSRRATEGDLPPVPTLFLDLYARTGAQWRCLRLAPPDVDFSGLGDRMQPTAKANIQTVLDVLRADFQNARVDDRLVHVTYHYKIVSGKAMLRLLGEISEDLAALAPVDLGSRLAFLTVK